MGLSHTVDPPAEYVRSFQHCRVLVLGDAILDEYLLGDCSRISPEAPVPVLKVTRVRQVLGGAANTAANVVSLGGEGTLIALVGSDEPGMTLRRCAAEARIELVAIDRGIPTLRKTRVVGQQQQIVRLDYEVIPSLDASTRADILERVDASLAVCDVVVISDYAKGLISPPLAAAIIRRAHDAGRAVIVDPRPENRECYRGCDYITPNWRESRALLGLPDGEPAPAEVAAVARTLALEFEANVVLTLGRHGIAFCSRSGADQFALPTLAREVYDVSGAGDTVVATFALAHACGADHAAALTLANRAASVAVAKFGTATVTPEEILQGTEAVRLVPRHDLAELAATLRARGRRIAALTGTFERLDREQLRLLTDTRRLADVLVVGLITDAPGEGGSRWSSSARARTELLLAVRMVDYVHVLADSDRQAFLSELNPDVHIDGCGEAGIGTAVGAAATPADYGPAPA